MIGHLIHNRYRVDEIIGQGGMGTVYRGYDLLLSRTVAIKVLTGLTLGTEGRARLLNEAQAAARLNHPNIVTVFDAGETDHAPFIVMELAPGKTLRQNALQNLDIVEDIIRQTCAALEHAHSSGIIHRDIKPENIILTPSGTVKLMDFGLARSDQASRLTTTGEISGTLLYLAPELWQGQPPNPKTDLYALGVMFYELACGQAPFQGDTFPALIDQIAHAVPVPPSKYNPNVSPAMDALILRLLEKQPENRPASAAEVRIALDPGRIHTPEIGSSAGKYNADQGPAPGAPPFKGLQFFAESDADLFFGRESLTARLVGHVQQMISARGQSSAGVGCFLAVIGASGSGKSSLVRAGLVPALKSGTGLPAALTAIQKSLDEG